MMNTKSNLVFGAIVLFFACGKSSKSNPDPVIPVSSSFTFSTLKVNGQASGFSYTNVNAKPAIAISFSTPLGQASVTGSVSLATKAGAAAAYSVAFQHHDSTVVITPTGLLPITQYSLKVSTALKSAKGSNLQSALEVQLTTAIDSTAKFPTITDEQLLDLVERQTLKYFYDFGHPTSGLARERNSSGDVVTSGGSGFGIMAIVAGISRGYISYADGLARMQKIVSFLNTKAQKFHGAFPHWLNGATGAIVPFSTQDNGADLVETSYLMQGLITARQYFSSANAAETQLRADINTLWNGVEWDWFRQNDQNALYWHWSPDQGWAINMKITGWNEALIVYVLGASSTTHNIPKTVYDQGWAGSGGIKNGKTFYGVTLPLGPDRGGPLFFEHYSFLGINPTGLTDAYANYETQTKAHAMINYNYCVANPWVMAVIAPTAGD
ncbi:glucoamylase family protein [Mucilaginibacter sp. P25]|uniref:glucoamylase family protein n=1 Tax=Mucilaginibacter sp. P25 TaxID=3423945 RepID=UPI003D7A6CCC